MTAHRNWCGIVARPATSVVAMAVELPVGSGVGYAQQRSYELDLLHFHG